MRLGDLAVAGPKKCLHDRQVDITSVNAVFVCSQVRGHNSRGLKF